MKQKKGFTIVELVIVIAVIAILAAVLIPTFSNLINRANVSADQQAVRQMNLALASESVTNRPTNAEEAKAILRKANFNVDSYTPMNSDYVFYYDSDEIKVLIYDQKAKKVVYPEELAKKYSNYEGGRLSMNWYVLNENQYEVLTLSELGAESLQEALAASTSYQTVRIEKDVTLDRTAFPVIDGYYTFPVNENGTANLDLGGHTLTLDTGDFDVVIGELNSVRITNGTLLNTVTQEGINGGLAVKDGGSLTLDGVVFETNGTGIFPAGTASEINILNATVKAGGYGLATNARGDLSWNVLINVRNSTIESEVAGILVNVPCIVNVENSTIKGDGIGACIRGGSATFKNCTIVEVGANDWAASCAVGENKEFSLYSGSPFANGWGSGNTVQFGGLIVGDWSSNAYNYDASCILINTQVRVEDTGVAFPRVYLSQDGENTTSLTYDAASDIGDVIINSATNLPRGVIFVNGKSV